MGKILFIDFKAPKGLKMNFNLSQARKSEICFRVVHFSKSGGRFYFQSSVRVKTTRGARFRWEISGFISNPSVSSLLLLIDDYDAVHVTENDFIFIFSVNPGVYNRIC